jgi:hypothetical protein
MSEYSVQVKDKTLKMLMDPNLRYIDTETENHILTSIIGRIDKWPSQFRKVTFSPTESLMDAIALMSFAAPGHNWGLECKETAIDYEAWVEDKYFSVRSWNPARAITAAVWNRHNIKKAQAEQAEKDKATE